MLSNPQRKRERESDRGSGFSTNPRQIPHTTSPPEKVIVPILSPERTNFIDIFAVRLCAAGLAFEEVMKDREAHNPFFRFLFAPWDDPEVIYYRWRTWQLLNEKGKILTWRTQPFRITLTSLRMYIPPPELHVSLFPPTKVDPATTRLRTDRRSFETSIAILVADKDMLYPELPEALSTEWMRRLAKCGSLSSKIIGATMSFAIKNHHYRFALMVALTQSMVVVPSLKGPPPTELELQKIVRDRVGKLFVVNDILHNIISAEKTIKALDAGGAKEELLRVAGCFRDATELLLPHMIDAIVFTMLYLKRIHNNDGKRIASISTTTSPAPEGAKPPTTTAAKKREESGPTDTPFTMEVEEGEPAHLLLGWTRNLLDIWSSNTKAKNLLPIKALSEARTKLGKFRPK